MNEAMTIRCPECGYENRDMYRFCGMCGATLRQETAPEQAPVERQTSEAPAVTEPKLPAVQPVSTQAPSRSLDYLLEDEPPKSRAKLYLTLVLLVVAAGLMLWHWTHDGYPAVESTSPASSAAPTSASSPPAATPEAQSPPPPAKASAPPVKVAPAAKPADVQPPATTNAAPAESGATEPPKSRSESSGRIDTRARRAA